MKPENLLRLVEEEHGKPIRSTQVKDLITVLARLLPTVAEVEKIHHWVPICNDCAHFSDCDRPDVSLSGCARYKKVWSFRSEGSCP